MFSYKVIKKVNLEQLEQLYREAGWWEDTFNAREFVPAMIKNSFCVVGAFDRCNTLVGIGRALSDGISDAYIQDVCVQKSLRGNGIGSEIIRHIIAELQAGKIDWIGLIGEPDTRRFYEKLNFRELKNHIPMKLEL